MSANGQRVVLIDARSIAVNVRRVDDRLVLFGPEIPRLRNLDLDPTEPLSDIGRIVSGIPAASFTKPKEADHTPLPLRSHQRVHVPCCPPFGQHRQVQLLEKSDSLAGAERKQAGRVRRYLRTCFILRIDFEASCEY